MIDRETNNHLVAAREVFKIEAEAVAGLIQNLNADFPRAVEHILRSAARVVVCGMGKSGIIGKKIAATLASTGTPSFFMHPGEAYHGDLGMIASDDVFVAISFSGETDEVVKLLPFIRENKNFLIAMTGSKLSTLAKAAECHLDISIKKEACPLQLAPTASTTAALAMGDALAIALMRARDFKPENFARFHPGGSIGRRLLSKVENEMVSNDLPYVEPKSSVMDVIHAITRAKLGLALVKLHQGYALITDGDLRRAVESHGKSVFDKQAEDLMTVNPTIVLAGTRIEDALAIMERQKISALLVYKDETLVGVFKK